MTQPTGLLNQEAVLKTRTETRAARGTSVAGLVLVCILSAWSGCKVVEGISLSSSLSLSQPHWRSKLMATVDPSSARSQSAPGNENYVPPNIGRQGGTRMRKCGTIRPVSSLPGPGNSRRCGRFPCDMARVCRRRHLIPSTPKRRKSASTDRTAKFQMVLLIAFGLLMHSNHIHAVMLASTCVSSH